MTQGIESKKDKNRGKSPEDEKIFAAKEIERLVKAQEEVSWLLDRKYPLSNVMTFVGDRYQFTARQRSAIQRATCSKIQCENRESKILCTSELCKDIIHIDGFNFIITMEVALSGGTLIRGMDGAIRDLAGLRGNYRIIDKTYKALDLLGKVIKEEKIPGICFWVDAPVSNSGRLKSSILEYSKEWGIPVKVEIVPNPDSVLATLDRIVTSDGIILDECESWFNLSEYIIMKHMAETKIIDLR